MGSGRRRLWAVLAAAFGLAALAAAPGASAATTIGADVNQVHPNTYIGACGPTPANRPCTVVNLATNPARTLQAPCDGKVSAFRLNGVVTANTYRLRAVTDNGNGTWTPTATSSPPVSIQADGVNTYAASMPIKQGQYVGIDFMDSTAAGLRGIGAPGFNEAYFYSFPADGGIDTPGFDSAIYLYNADVECGGPSGQQPAGTQCKKKKKKKKGKKKSAAAAKKKKKKKGCKKKKKKKKK
jgi:hypothetical protein